MLPFAISPWRFWQRAWTTSSARRCLSTSTSRFHHPLRILFCGADDFSIHSLRALHALKEKKPHTISSIDVVCRPDKRAGRGLKRIQQVPIKPVAQELSLPIHQIDTFTGWTPPSPVDLVVAVSFGLLVPGRILNDARYGGFNVHPSLLPDLRGPSPLQHALMLGRKRTGVSLQTMHPTKFDHGMILAQESISIPEDCSFAQLSDLLAALGASLLRTVVENGLFEEPMSMSNIDSSQPSELALAPKITKEDAHINWGTWTADRICRYGRVFQLWDEMVHEACIPGARARVKYQGPWRIVDAAEIPEYDPVADRRGSSEPGTPVAFRQPGLKAQRLAIHTFDGRLVTPSSASIEGKREGSGIQALTQALVKAQHTVVSHEHSPAT